MILNLRKESGTSPQTFQLVSDSKLPVKSQSRMTGNERSNLVYKCFCWVCEGSDYLLNIQFTDSQTYQGGQSP